MNEEKIEHESFATLQINRVQGRAENLFGSSIGHQHFIELSIHPAYIDRSLHRDWIYCKNLPYIKVQMSNTQFAEAITSMNQGSGTPCTLREITVGGQRYTMEHPPSNDKRKQIDDEFTNKMEDFSKGLKEQLPDIEKIIERLPKKYQEELRNRLTNIFTQIDSNIPFIKKSFTEQMDKTTLEAKGEIEGFFLNKIHDLGIKNLKMNDVLRIEDKNETNK